MGEVQDGTPYRPVLCEVAASRLIRDALRRAPSFIFWNTVFDSSLDEHCRQHNLSDDTKDVIRDCAKRLLQEKGIEHFLGLKKGTSA